MKELNNGLRFGLGDKVFAVYKDDTWKVKESLVLGVNLASRYCYFTESDVGKWEHAEGELFATKKEAEFAVEILKNNTGGIKEVTVDEVAQVAKDDNVTNVTPSWISRKFKVAYSRAYELAKELKERTGGADE